MNKKDLIEQVSERINLTKKDTGIMVDLVFDTVKDALQKGESINIAGFGCFDVKTRAARNTKNPRTGENISVPETVVPRFKPGKRMKELIAKK